MLLAAPVRFANPLKASAPIVPEPEPLSVHVVSAAGPRSVLPDPSAAIAATFENDRVTGPLTLPDEPPALKLAPLPFTVSELAPPPPS